MNHPSILVRDRRIQSSRSVIKTVAITVACLGIGFYGAAVLGGSCDHGISSHVTNYVQAELYDMVRDILSSIRFA
jgi:hypothetical protein